MKEILSSPWMGIPLSLAIGALVRWVGMPSPAPNSLPGALMVLALTVGYLAVDFLMRR